MLSDSRVTGATKGLCRKIWTTPQGHLVGGAGDRATMLYFEHVLKWPAKLSTETLVRWVHRNLDRVKFDNVEMLVTDGKLLFEICSQCVTELTTAGAVGSGAAWAQGYLRARPDDLKGAVEAACYYDPYCAGPVQEFAL